MLDIFQILNKTLTPFNLPAASWNIAFEPLPAAILSHARDRGGNVLGLRPEDGSSYGMHFNLPDIEIRSEGAAADTLTYSGPLRSRPNTATNDAVDKTGRAALQRFRRMLGRGACCAGFST